MKRLLFDHLGRKVWFLVAAALLTALIGWGMAATPEAELPHREIYGLVSQVGVIVGTAMLFWDLQRGAGRTVALLPLSRVQIAWAWWLAAVAVPAGLLSLSLVAGALAHAVFSIKGGLQLEPLLVAILSLWLITGAAFALLLNMPLGPARGWKQRGAVGGWIFVVCCGTLMSKVPFSPGLLVVLLTIGVSATMLGWYFAPRLVGKGAQYDGTDFEKVTGRAAENFRPKRWGGVPYLLTETALRSFYLTALFIVGMTVFHLIGNPGGGSVPKLLRLIPILAASAFPMTFLLGFQSLFPQLRSLRALPLSASGLATLMLSVMLLPAGMLSALIFSVLACVPASPFRPVFALVVMLYLSVGAFALLGLVLLGGGKRSIAFVFVVFIGSQFAMIPLMMSMNDAQSPLPLGLAAGATVLVVVVVLFALTSALARCNRIYRPKAFGDMRPVWERQ